MRGAFPKIAGRLEASDEGLDAAIRVACADFGSGTLVQRVDEMASEDERTEGDNHRQDETEHPWKIATHPDRRSESGGSTDSKSRSVWLSEPRPGHRPAARVLPMPCGAH